MISTKEKWVLGGLLAVSAAIWTPQVVARIAPETSAQIAMSDGPDESEMLSIETQAAGGSLGSGAGTGGPMPLASQLPSTGDQRQSMAGGPVDARDIAGPDALVGQVLKALGGAEVFGVAEKATEIAASVEEPVEVEFLPEVNIESRLLTFVSTNPLRGTIAGESLAVALIGDHRVRLGDLVPGTQAVVTHIERGRVTLEENGIAIDLELAPLKTSVASMRAKEAQRERLSAQSQGGGDGAIPGGGSLGAAPMGPEGDPMPTDISPISTPSGAAGPGKESSPEAEGTDSTVDGAQGQGGF